MYMCVCEYMCTHIELLYLTRYIYPLYPCPLIKEKLRPYITYVILSLSRDLPEDIMSPVSLIILVTPRIL